MSKSGFPLGILPVVQLVSATFHALVSVAVLIVAQLLFKGSLPLTALLLPLVLLPFLLLTLGLAWCLASLGVFVRDVGQTISLVTSVMLFMSPCFSIAILATRSATLDASQPLDFCD